MGGVEAGDGTVQRLARMPPARDGNRQAFAASMTDGDSPGEVFTARPCRYIPPHDGTQAQRPEASVALVEGSRGCMTGVSGPRRFVLWVFCQLQDSMDALDALCSGVAAAAAAAPRQRERSQAAESEVAARRGQGRGHAVPIVRWGWHGRRTDCRGRLPQRSKG